MARPKKEKELKRNHIVTLRFNDTEYEIVTGNAKDTGLPLAEFLRRQVMKGKVIAKYEIVADVPELKKLTAEFPLLHSITKYLLSPMNHKLSVPAPSVNVSGRSDSKPSSSPTVSNARSKSCVLFENDILSGTELI